jgi:type III restriction enzyme
VGYMIAETKGFDELEEVKREAAERWVNAVNVEGSFGRWCYKVAKQVSDIPRLISSAAGA